MKHAKKLLSLIGLVSMLMFSGLVAAQSVYSLAPGDNLLVSCRNALTGAAVATNQFNVRCAANTATPTAVPPTATKVSTATPLPSATATLPPTPTATLIAPTATPPVLAAVDPLILGTCTAAIHDRYAVVGPDGKLYRTWHPQVVPVDLANPSAGVCVFAHEHGDNPVLSVANPSLPAFGYIGAQVNDSEPHEGFKVYVINAGTLNNDGWTANNSTRAVFHQGTGGPKRFDTQFHSLQFDLTGPNGLYVHVYGMADTGLAASICADPRRGRTVVVLPSQCAISSPYEIWSATLTLLGGRTTVVSAFGVFDPITVLDLASLPGQRPYILTANVYPNFAPFNGCDRESYAGPVYLANGGGSTTFTTDAYGNAGSVFTQRVSSVTIEPPGANMASGNPYQMKLRTNQCAPGLGLKN